MHWSDGDTTSDRFDVAEVGEPRRRNVPRWLRFGLLVLGAMVVGWLLLQRLTAADTGVEVADPRFDSNYVVQVDLTVTNRLGDPQVLLAPKPPKLPGLEYVGMFRGERVTEYGEDGSADAVPLAPHGRRTLTLVWKVRDCVPALAAGGRQVVVPLEVGRAIGAKATLQVSTGRQRDLLPSVCDTSPTTGQPRFVASESDSAPGENSTITTFVRVQNTGGRPISYRSTGLPSGAAIDLTPRLPDRYGPVPVGDQQAVLLSFRSNDCRVPEQGPATVVMRFRSTGSDRDETLEVRLADSWANFLGVCTP
ncbi:hypothetical protein [Actinopolymorpha pittospori]|uniref:Uncharacterized protein n=1 Tax=Actinopolymorpha pittospori TaxID=648752 RepID=A0A927N3C7_9ACTN|nr:hypothetical protein [Actinopolymorpha pittospori]MBE1611900.1 hypothetical protein [Actinopolymorpha pittospori]